MDLQLHSINNRFCLGVSKPHSCVKCDEVLEPAASGRHWGWNGQEEVRPLQEDGSVLLAEVQCGPFRFVLLFYVKLSRLLGNTCAQSLWCLRTDPVSKMLLK